MDKQRFSQFKGDLNNVFYRIKQGGENIDSLIQLLVQWYPELEPGFNLPDLVKKQDVNVYVEMDGDGEPQPSKKKRKTKNEEEIGRRLKDNLKANPELVPGFNLPDLVKKQDVNVYVEMDGDGEPQPSKKKRKTKNEEEIGRRLKDNLKANPELVPGFNLPDLVKKQDVNVNLEMDGEGESQPSKKKRKTKNVQEIGRRLKDSLKANRWTNFTDYHPDLSSKESCLNSLLSKKHCQRQESEPFTFHN